MAYGQPNYGYQNYGYQNQFNPYQYGQTMNMSQFQPQAIQPTIQQQTQQIQPTSSYPTIYGKVVDGIDVAKSLDVPLGMSFILPKADGTSVYCKGWLDNGTTYIKEYKLVEDNTKDEADSDDRYNVKEKLDDIYNSIDSLSKKIDKIDKIKPTSSSISTRKKKVEEVEDDE